MKPTVNEGRHAAECKICAHPLRDEIERDFVNWRSPSSITKQYGLRNRSSVYRHAHATGLFAKRQPKRKATLSPIHVDGLPRARHKMLPSSRLRTSSSSAEPQAPSRQKPFWSTLFVSEITRT